jgi:hypothetical protein
MGTLQARQVPHDVWSPVAVTNYAKIHDRLTLLKSDGVLKFALKVSASSAEFGNNSSTIREITTT